MFYYIVNFVLFSLSTCISLPSWSLDSMSFKDLWTMRTSDILSSFPIPSEPSITLIFRDDKSIYLYNNETSDQKSFTISDAIMDVSYANFFYDGEIQKLVICDYTSKYAFIKVLSTVGVTKISDVINCNSNGRVLFIVTMSGTTLKIGKYENGQLDNDIQYNNAKLITSDSKYLIIYHTTEDKFTYSIFKGEGDDYYVSTPNNIDISGIPFYETTVMYHYETTIPSRKYLVLATYTNQTTNFSYYIYCIDTQSFIVSETSPYFLYPQQELYKVEFIPYTSRNYGNFYMYSSVMYFQFKNLNQAKTIGLFNPLTNVLTFSYLVETNELYSSFITSSTINSIFAVMRSYDKKTLYQFCPFFMNDNGDCIAFCNENEYNYIDMIKGNKCTQSCTSGTEQKYEYENNNIKYCLDECPRGYEANDNNQCVKCASSKKFYLNNKCLENCPYSYFIDDNNNCYDCYDKSIDDFYYNGQCVQNCPIFYTYKHTGRKECATCSVSDPSTPYYTGWNGCTDQCQKRVDEHCVICEEGKYEDPENETCISKEKCISKSGYGIYKNYQCIHCLSSFLVLGTINGECMEQCDLIYNIRNNTCSPCSNSNQKYDPLGKTCVDKCPTNTVTDTYKCIYCSEEPVNKFYYKNQCASECPIYTVATVNNICEKCSSIYDISSHQCVSFCPYGTVKEHNELNDIDVCLSCSMNKTYLDQISNRCVTSCSKGYYPDDKGICVKNCYESCDNCFGLGNAKNNKCINCKENFYPLESKTYMCYNEEDRVEGYYLNKTLEQFSKCHSNCKFCYDKGSIAMNNCTKCIDGLFFDPYSEYGNCKEGEKIEEGLILSTNPISDEYDSRIDEYKDLSTEAKENYLSTEIENFTTEQKDITKNMNDIIYINKLLMSFDSQKKKNKFIDTLVTKTSTLFACDSKNINSIFSQSTYDSDSLLLSLLSLYYTSNNVDISTSEKSKNSISKFLSCFTSNTLSMISKTSTINSIALTLLKDDFNSILSETIENVISIRYESNKISTVLTPSKKNNKTYMIKNSLVTVDEALTLKKVNDEYAHNLLSLYKNENVHRSHNDYSDIISITLISGDSIKKLTKQLEQSGYSMLLSLKMDINEEINTTIDNSISEMKENNKNISIILPYFIQSENTQYSLSVISYDKYPLLHPEVSEINQNVISIALYNSNDVKITKFPKNDNITFIIKKPYASFNECIFFDENTYNWNNTNCLSIDRKEYLACSCDHLTDFSMSLYPLSLVYESFKLLTNVKIMDSFEPFKYLNWENGKVFFIYMGLLGVFLIGLIPSLWFDLVKDGNFFLSDEEDDEGCCSEEIIKCELIELRKKTDEDINQRKESAIQRYFGINLENKQRSRTVLKALGIEIEMTDKEEEKKEENDIKVQKDQSPINSTKKKKNIFSLSNDNKDALLDVENGNKKEDIVLPIIPPSPPKKDEKNEAKHHYNSKEEILSQISKMKNSQYPYEWFYRSLYIIKLFFKNEYRLLVIFLNKPNQMTKTNILVLIIIRLAVSLAICALLSECNEKNTSERYLNREISVAILTIFIIEIPFTIFEFLLNKSKIKDKNEKMKIRAKTAATQVVIYILFFLLFVFGTLNTTWISITRDKENRECEFLNEFLWNTLLDNFVYEILIILSKSIVYFILIRNMKMNFCKKCMIGVLAALPFIFALNG